MGPSVRPRRFKFCAAWPDIPDVAAVRDDKSGTVYFYHTLTLETTWEPPPGYVDAFASHLWKSAADGEDPPALPSTSNHATQQDKVVELQAEVRALREENERLKQTNQAI